MKFFVTFLLFGVCLVQSAPTTLLSTITSQQIGSNPPPQISRYIGQSNYPGYYVYNYLQVDHGREIPVAVLADSTPGIQHFQPTYTYFGTPFYDYRYQLNQLFPGFVGYYQPPPTLIPSGQPSYVPPQGPTFQPTTERPSYEDDGVEKLDEKLEPASMETDNNNNDDAHREDDDDDDSVTIDAI